MIDHYDIRDLPVRHQLDIHRFRLHDEMKALRYAVMEGDLEKADRFIEAIRQRAIQIKGLLQNEQKIRRTTQRADQ